MEVVVLTEAPGPELLAEWRGRAGAAGVELRLCKTREEADGAVSAAIWREAESGGALVEFHARDGLCYLRRSGIVFLRSNGHRAEIGLSDGRVLCSKALRVSTQTVLRPFVEGGRFLQTAGTAFVNLDYVNAVAREGVALTTGQTLPITRYHFNALLARSGGRGSPPLRSG